LSCSLSFLAQNVNEIKIQITLAGAPLTATDNTTLQTNLNDMSGAPVVLVSGGTLPRKFVLPIPSTMAKYYCTQIRYSQDVPRELAIKF
jgi:hypothetical protein